MELFLINNNIQGNTIISPTRNRNFYKILESNNESSNCTKYKNKRYRGGQFSVTLIYKGTSSQNQSNQQQKAYVSYGRTTVGGRNEERVKDVDLPKFIECNHRVL